MGDRYAERSVIKFKDPSNYSWWVGYAARFDNHEDALVNLLEAHDNDTENVGGGNF